MEPDPHFKSSWIRICIQKTAGFGSAKNECGSTALMVGEMELSKSRVVGRNPTYFRPKRKFYFLGFISLTQIRVALEENLLLLFKTILHHDSLG